MDEESDFSVWWDSGPEEDVMSYVCAICKVQYPCTNEEHNQMWSNKVFYPSGRLESIACFVLDHTECTTPMFCKCRCHSVSILDEPSDKEPSNTPPSNR